MSSKPLSAGEYIYVYDSKTDTFPESYRVLNGGESIDNWPEKELTGVISFEEYEELWPSLRAKYPDSRYEVEQLRSTSWDAVKRNHVGLHHYDSDQYEDGDD